MTWARVLSNLRFTLAIGLEESDATDAAALAPRAVADFISRLTESETKYWGCELV